MKTQKLRIMIIGLLCLSIIFSCNFKLNESEKTENLEKEPTTSEKVITTQPVVTTGNMATPVVDGSGNVTLTVTDSDGGEYVFTQPNSQRKSAVASGNWQYSKSGIVQFSGSFSGNISNDMTSLDLKVENAVDSSGKLQPAKNPVPFKFIVSDTSFEATIPSVDIVVSVSDAEEENPEPVVVLIKSAILSDGINGQAVMDFYSDSTVKVIYKYFGEIEDFSWNVLFDAGIGVCYGNPLEEEEIEIRFDYFTNGSGWFSEINKVLYESYLNGDKSKEINLGNEFLLKYGMPGSIWGKIVGDEFIFLRNRDCIFEENGDGSTSFEVRVIGDYAEQFVGKYGLTNSYDCGGNHIDFAFDSEIPLDTTEDCRICYHLYLKSDENIQLGNSFDIKVGYKSIYEVELEKAQFNVSLDGDSSLITNPLIIVNKNGSWIGTSDILSSTSGTLEAFYDKKNVNMLPVQVFEDVNNDGEYTYRVDYPMSDEVYVLVNEKNIVIPIFEKKPTFLEEKINFICGRNSGDLTDEQLSHYGFYRTGNEIYFYIPAGEGTDGDFITCFQCEKENPEWHSGDHFWTLAKMVFPFSDVVNDCWEYQYSEFLDIMKKIVEYLEDKKGLEVFGKELIGLE